MGKKKPARELTTEEALRRVLPAKVVRELKKVAHERDDAEQHGSDTPANINQLSKLKLDEVRNTKLLGSSSLA